MNLQTDIKNWECDDLSNVFCKFSLPLSFPLKKWALGKLKNIYTFFLIILLPLKNIYCLIKQHKLESRCGFLLHVLFSCYPGMRFQHHGQLPTVVVWCSCQSCTEFPSAVSKIQKWTRFKWIWASVDSVFYTELDYLHWSACQQCWCWS